MKLMQMKYHDEFSILGIISKISSMAIFSKYLALLTLHAAVLCLGKHLYSLAHAASGYQRVLQENRKLYNIVQDLKGKWTCEKSLV